MFTCRKEASDHILHAHYNLVSLPCEAAQAFISRGQSDFKTSLHWSEGKAFSLDWVQRHVLQLLFVEHYSNAQGALFGKVYEH